MELKFRQPLFNKDGTFKEWHYWGVNIEQGGTIANVGWATKYLPITDPAQSQQCTGYKDKYGEDIYIGDFIESPTSRRVFPVTFKDGRLTAELTNNILATALWHRSRIIGNIYQSAIS